MQLGVGQRRRAVAAEDVGGLHQSFGLPAVDELLDHQGAENIHPGAALLMIVFIRIGFVERQHVELLGVRFVDVFVDRLFNLRGEVRRIARIPEIFAAAADRSSQVA